jgi:hypothetical protein
MATRRAIKGVLDNFLGTFTSRYSDYHGYWLFGFLVADAGSLNIDLLPVSVQPGGGPVTAAGDLAVRKFNDQLAKHGLAKPHLRAAAVAIERLPLTVDGQVNGHEVVGYQVRVFASATTDRGRQYQSERLLFVAPHNPSIESRSTRANDPLLPAGIVSAIGKLLGRSPGQ